MAIKLRACTLPIIRIEEEAKEDTGPEMAKYGIPYEHDVSFRSDFACLTAPPTATRRILCVHVGDRVLSSRCQVAFPPPSLHRAAHVRPTLDEGKHLGDSVIPQVDDGRLQDDGTLRARETNTADGISRPEPEGEWGRRGRGREGKMLYAKTCRRRKPGRQGTGKHITRTQHHKHKARHAGAHSWGLTDSGVTVCA